MPAFLLDTNHLSAAINPVSRLREKLYQARRTGMRLGTCVPVLCELEVGLYGSRHADSYRRQLIHLRKHVRIWPLPDQIAQTYGQIFHELRRRGRALSQVDMMLAALAKFNKTPLLTSDQDFAALPEIRTENWLE